MKDLTKEERLEQRISKLERQIYEKEDIFDKEQGKRLKITFFVLSGVIYLIAFMTGGISDIASLLSWLVVAPVFAGLTIFASLLVLLYVSSCATQRIRTIANLEGKLEEAKYNKYNTCKDENTKEIKSDLKYLGDLLEAIVDQYNDLELYEEFENEAEEIEVLRFQLEELESSLELIDNEYKNLKRKKIFNDEVEK